MANFKARPVAKDDYDGLKAQIKEVMKQPDYDDGSAGPVFVRLAWHASGTFSLIEHNGGSNGAGMRFGKEQVDPANAGLHHAISFLLPIQAANPWITHADLWTLAGVTAIEAMHGPKIPWRPGRTDYSDEAHADDHRGNIGDRLPDGALGAKHLREVFGRMGYSDQEIVALSGAHNLGRCHADRSGFDGPWVVNPTRFSNQYYKLLSTRKWVPRKWDGPLQYETIVAGERLMMLPTDMALMEDPEFRKWVLIYASDQSRFFNDFALAFGKLIELGVDRDDTGFAHLVRKAAEQKKPLDKVRMEGGCPFMNAARRGETEPSGKGKGRESKL